jgi:hypothetical protein
MFEGLKSLWRELMARPATLARAAQRRASTRAIRLADGGRKGREQADLERLITAAEHLAETTGSPIPAIFGTSRLPGSYSMSAHGPAMAPNAITANHIVAGQVEPSTVEAGRVRVANSSHVRGQPVEEPARNVDLAEPEQVQKTSGKAKMSKRKVWLEEERPSILAKREAARLKAIEEAEKLRAIEKREAELAAQRKVEAERHRQRIEEAAKASEQRLAALKAVGGFYDDRRKAINVGEEALALTEPFMAVEEIHALLPNAQTVLGLQVEVNTEADMNREASDYTVPEAPEGYSYYLLGIDVTLHAKESDRPDRVSVNVILPEIERRRELTLSRRTMPLGGLIALSSGLSQDLRLHLPAAMGDGIGALVLMRNEGREDMRSYRVDHTILNEVLRHRCHYGWRLENGREFSIFGMRATFGRYEQVVRGSTRLS